MPPFWQEGTTFLGVCSHLSPETYTKYVILSAGYLLSHRLHRLHRFSFVLRTPNLTTTYTTYTTSNGDTVAKGQVVLVVHVVVNSNYLSLTLFFVTQKSRKSRKVPSARAALRKRTENFCDFCAFLCDEKTAVIFGHSRNSSYLCSRVWQNGLYFWKNQRSVMLCLVY